MIDVLIFAVLSLIVGLASIYGKSPALRAASYACLVAGMLLLWYTSMGLPRPQYLQVPHGTVLGYRLDEPNAIYLWLIPDGAVRPLALELPWRNDVAKNLLEAAGSRGNPGDSIKIKNGLGGMGLPTKPVFYVSHTEGLPPKTPPR
jgi:hypothetical protein